MNCRISYNFSINFVNAVFCMPLSLNYDFFAVGLSVLFLHLFAQTFIFEQVYFISPMMTNDIQ